MCQKQINKTSWIGNKLTKYNLSEFSILIVATSNTLIYNFIKMWKQNKFFEIIILADTNIICIHFKRLTNGMASNF